MRFLLSFILVFGFCLRGIEASAQSKRSTREKRERLAQKVETKKPKKKNKKKSEKEVKAKEEVKPKEEPKVEVVKESTKTEIIETKPKSFEQRIGLSLWQENIEATRTATTGYMTTQSEGLMVALDWIRPYERSHWSLRYGADFASGFIKGSSLDGAFNDVVGNQRWIYFGGHASLIKRISQKTSAGFEVPILLRNIGWDLKDNDFKIDREWSFTAGLSLVYEIHFGSHALHMSIGNQYLWKSTVWTVAYEGKIF